MRFLESGDGRKIPIQGGFSSVVLRVSTNERFAEVCSSQDPVEFGSENVSTILSRIKMLS